MKVLDIYITEICNLNCEYCYVDLKKKEYDGFQYNEFIKRVNLIDFDFIKFLWWEPLLKYNEIKKIINSSLEKKNNLKFSIITNGLLITSEKLKFFREKNTSITISIHKKWIKKLLKKEFLLILLQYKEIIGFVILYDYNDLQFWTKIFRLLVSFWFRNFSITPLADISRDDNLIYKLQLELNIIKTIVNYNKDIKISETDNSYLKDTNRDNFCKKSQVDKSWIKRLCTRFDKESLLKNKIQIDFIYGLFDKNNDCKSCSDKWFCTCPIWWYLDNKWKIDDNNLSKIFHKLNKTFIRFYKDIVKIQNLKNFLTEWINEIRFNITENCNLRCGYCYLKFSDKKLDIEKAKNIVEYLLFQEWKEKTISFFWWEPMLEFDTIKEIVFYSKIRANTLWKNVNYKIATNWILLDSLKTQFFLDNNFEIHLSFNGTKEINNKTRDNSTKIFEKKIHLLRNYNNIIILLVLFPNFISDLGDSIKQIQEFWFKKISFEIYLWDKYTWLDENYEQLEKEFLKLNKMWYFYDIDIWNFNIDDDKYLDVSTNWKINSNSLEFFKNKIDFSPKKYLDSIIYKVFK